MCRRQEAAEARHHTHCRAHVPRGRHGASRAVGERARALVRGGPVARGRGAARREQQRARVQRGRGAAAAGVGARARRAAVERPAVRLDGDGGRRARGERAGVWRALRCAFGEAAAGGAWAGWRGGGASAASAGAAGAAASGVRCVSPTSAVTGWVGVQLGSPAGLASSGGSFYYHGSLAVAGLSPPLGPERGGMRVSLAIASSSGGGRRWRRRGRGLPRRVDGALPDGQRLGRGAGAARGRRAAGVRVCGAWAGRGARVALGERTRCCRCPV